MPSTESCAVEYQVIRSPLNASLVEVGGCLVIWADHIEVAVFENLLKHIFDGLFWRPCSSRFRAVCSTVDVGVYPAWDE